MLGNLHKKVITDLAIPLVRDNLLGLVSNLASNVVNKFERKIGGKKLWEEEKDLICSFWMKIWMVLLKPWNH